MNITKCLAETLRYALQILRKTEVSGSNAVIFW
jgi:hypothetical protein